MSETPGVGLSSNFTITLTYLTFGIFSSRTLLCVCLFPPENQELTWR